MNSPSTPFHPASPSGNAGSQTSPANDANVGSLVGSPVGILRTPTGQGTDTTNCPPPPDRRDRTRARRRVSFAPNA